MKDRMPNLASEVNKGICEKESSLPISQVVSDEGDRSVVEAVNSFPPRHYLA